MNNKKFNSYDEMISSIRNEIIQRKLVNSDKSQDEIIIKPDISMIAEVLIDTCNIAIKDHSNGQYTLFIENPDKLLMISSTSYLNKILTDISSHITKINNQIQKVKIKIKIDDIKQTSRKVLNKIIYNSTIRRLKPLPNHYLVFNNAIVNLNTYQVLSFDNLSKQYDLLSKNNINFIIDKQLTDNEIASITLYKQIISKAMKDWSSNDEEVEYLLWQIIYSVFQNDNHDKFFIIKCKNESSKSTFMKLLSSIADSNNVINLNIHQFSDSNMISHIDMQTKLIVGEDIGHYKVNQKSLSTLKSIVTNQPIVSRMKYNNDVVIETNALFIQFTNQSFDLSNHIDIKQHAIFIDLSNKRIDTTLDSLIKDQLFIDTLSMMCLDKINNR